LYVLIFLVSNGASPLKSPRGLMRSKTTMENGKRNGVENGINGIHG